MTLEIDPILPEPTEGDTKVDPLNTLIWIDRGGFLLKLYKRPSAEYKLEVVKRYGIAVGAIGHRTNAGMYVINSKDDGLPGPGAGDGPAWYIPDSPWVPPEKRGTIVPGGHPDNPILARWMGFNREEGEGIHGTRDRASIGTRASHGCVRMFEEDVIELYDRVPMFTPVVVI